MTLTSSGIARGARRAQAPPLARVTCIVDSIIIIFDHNFGSYPYYVFLCNAKNSNIKSLYYNIVLFHIQASVHEHDGTQVLTVSSCTSRSEEQKPTDNVVSITSCVTTDTSTST